MSNHKVDREARRAHILEMLREVGELTPRDAVERLGVSRQTVHADLQALVAAALLERRGAGRSTRYVAPRNEPLIFPTRGLREDRVWDEMKADPPFTGLPDATGSIAHYSVTEMVNNAVDHSGAPEVRIGARSEGGTLILEVQDDGIGAFERIRLTQGLQDHLDALQQLAKGKLTTQPDRHSGEGIFFTSKSVDYFLLESNGLRWIVDNRRDDQGAGTARQRKGTRVHWEIQEDTSTKLEDVFARYTDPESLMFSKTRTTVKLFDHGANLVSRSEAKRLVHGLERFAEVTVDFGGVAEVGQAFVDEVFRVWQRQHPDTKIEAVNMNRAVEFMVKRGLPGDVRGPSTR